MTYWNVCTVVRPMGALATLAIGQSDLYPYYFKLNLRSKQAILAGLVDLLVVSIGELTNETVGAGEFGGMAYLGVGCLRASVGNVLADAGGKDDRILQHERDMLADVGRLGVTQIHPIKPQRA